MEPGKYLYHCHLIYATNDTPHSLSISENGWTDQELGYYWLVKDFRPNTINHSHSGAAQTLLILDGHNSHCTYKFIQFAAENNIIVMCLPAHTTHALQPCDVGVFSPLSKLWKKEVSNAARNYITITKRNLLRHYHTARTRAFKEATIQNVFAKCSISPFNPSVIPLESFAPSLTTSTQPDAGVIIPIELPSLLVPIFPYEGELTLPDLVSNQ